MSLKNHFVRKLSLATCLSLPLGGASLMAQQASRDMPMSTEGVGSEKKTQETKNIGGSKDNSISKKNSYEERAAAVQAAFAANKRMRRHSAEGRVQDIVDTHMNKKVGGVFGSGYLGAHDKAGYKAAIAEAKHALKEFPDLQKDFLGKLSAHYELSKQDIDQRGNDNIFRTNASHHHEEIQKALREFEAHIQAQQPPKQEHKEQGVDHHAPSTVPSSKPDHMAAPSQHLKEQQPVHGGTHGGH